MLGGGTGGAAGEGAAAARKFGGGGHGGSALVRPEREREGTGEGWGSSGARLWRSRAFGSAWHEVGCTSAMVGCAPVHGVHEDKLSSTWRALELTWWGADLCRFRAESDSGPKMKFAQL